MGSWENCELTDVGISGGEEMYIEEYMALFTIVSKYSHKSTYRYVSENQQTRIFFSILTENMINR